MRRNALIGIAVGVLTVFGLWFLGNAGAQIDTPGRTPDKERTTYRAGEPDEPVVGTVDAGELLPSDAGGAGGGNGDDFEPGPAGARGE